MLIMLGLSACANRRNPGGAMSHDGNFDRLDVGQEFVRGMQNVPCMRTFQNRSEPGGLGKPQTSAQLIGIEPSPHSGVGPGGIGSAQSVKASSIVLMLFLLRHRHAVPLKSPATTSIC